MGGYCLGVAVIWSVPSPKAKAMLQPSVSALSCWSLESKGHFCRVQEPKQCIRINKKRTPKIEINTGTYLFFCSSSIWYML